jgi:hypothetical protein
MAMSATRVAAAIQAGLTALYTVQNMQDNEGTPGYTLAQWSTIVATAIVDEITEHARAIGTDSGGDSIDIPIF